MLEIISPPTSLEQISQKYRRVLEQYPNEVNALMALAEVSALRGLRLEAQLAYEAAAKQHDGSEAIASLASIYYGHGLIAQSSDELVKIENLPEARLEVSYLRNLIAKQTGNPDLKETLLSPEPEIVRRKLKLALQRSLMLRDLQELLQLTEARTSSPLALYRVEETKRRLEELEAQQSYLEDYSRNHHDRIAEEARQNSLELERLESIRHLSGNEDKNSAADWNGSESWDTASTADETEQPTVPDEVTPEFVSEPEFVPESQTEPHDGLEETTLTVTPALESELPPVILGELGDDLQLEVVQEPEFVIDLEYEHVDLNSIDEEIESLQSAEIVSLELESRESKSPESSTELAPEPLATPIEPTPPSIEPEPVVIQTPPPPVEIAPVEVIAAPVEVAPSAPLAVSDPMALRKALAEPLAVLARTRGVTSIHILTPGGQVIEQTGLEGLESKRFSEFVVEGMAILNSFASRPSYWVTECTGGILVLQTLSDEHVLVTVGQTGANFGTLRYTMDKVKSQLCSILAAKP